MEYDVKGNLKDVKDSLPAGVNLVTVSKFHPAEYIEAAYQEGQRIFGESHEQELSRKVKELPGDIRWHFIGHLQTNKLKMVLPYVDLVQSVDSLRLLDAIDAWGKDNGRKVNVLLELHIAAEESKQGFVEEEVLDILFRADKYRNVAFCGLMGMATNTDCEEDIRADFARISSFMDYLKDLFPELEEFRELSIGMSDDWKIALEYGATMVRIGTSIFGPREY